MNDTMTTIDRFSGLSPRKRIRSGLRFSALWICFLFFFVAGPANTAGFPETIEAAHDVAPNKAFLFRKDQNFVVYDTSKSAVLSGPTTVASDAITRALGPFTSKLGAALTFGNTHYYFLTDGWYLSIDANSGSLNRHSTIASDWSGVGPYATMIEAAFRWKGNKVMFFLSDGNYLRYDMASRRVDANYPMPINNSNWPGLGPHAGKIKAAMRWNSNWLTLFLDGDRMMNYDVVKDEAGPLGVQLVRNHPLFKLFGPTGMPTASSPASAAQPAVDITGQWMTGDIQCPAGTKSSASLTVVQMAQQVMAIKVTGDDCVPAGYKFFQGSVSGNFGPVTCFSGTPQNPVSTNSPGALIIVDANNIKVCGATLVRTAPAQAVSPATKTPTQLFPTSKQPGAQSVVPTAPAPTAKAPPPRATPTGPTKAQRKAEVEFLMTQVMGQLSTVGATAVLPRYSSLQPRYRRDHKLGTLKAGYYYTVAAACDRFCDGVSVIIFDGSGKEIGRQTGKRPAPTTSGPRTVEVWTTVSFTPPQDQIYTARVFMDDCKSNPCEYGMFLANKPVAATAATPAPATSPPAPVIDRVKHVQQFVATLLAKEAQLGTTVVLKTDGTHALANGGYVDMPLGYLEHGRWYRYVGTCDLGCYNLDLALMDTNSGNYLGPKDTGSGKQPLFEFQAVAGQLYSVRVNMIECRSGPCNWALVGAIL